MSRWRRQLSRRHARARAARYLNYFPAAHGIKMRPLTDLLRAGAASRGRVVIATPDGRVMLPDGTTMQREPPASIEQWAAGLASDLARLK